MPCAGAALHLTAATCILHKSFTSSPGQKIKGVPRSALVQSARCPCCARLRPHSGTHGRPSGLFPCGFVRTRSAGSRLRFKIRVTDKMSRGSTSAAEVVLSFDQRVRLPCFIFLNHKCSSRFGFRRWSVQLSHLCFKKTSPSFPRGRSRFFEGEVMGANRFLLL